MPEAKFFSKRSSSVASVSKESNAASIRRERKLSEYREAKLAKELD